jgi:hypothetical protein
MSIGRSSHDLPSEWNHCSLEQHGLVYHQSWLVWIINHEVTQYQYHFSNSSSKCLLSLTINSLTKPKYPKYLTIVGSFKGLNIRCSAPLRLICCSLTYCTTWANEYTWFSFSSSQSRYLSSPSRNILKRSSSNYE